MTSGGLIQDAASGFGPGALFGVMVGSARAYLNGLSHAQMTAALAAAKASARPPTGAALAAMTPTPPLRMIASATALFAAAGTVFATTEPIIAGARGGSGDSDLLSGMVAGCAAGAVFGLKNGSVATSAGACAACAAMSAFVDIVETGNDDTVRRRKAVYGVVEPDVVQSAAAPDS